MLIGTFVSPDTLVDGQLGWCGYISVFCRFNPYPANVENMVSSK